MLFATVYSNFLKATTALSPTAPKPKESDSARDDSPGSR